MRGEYILFLSLLAPVLAYKAGWMKYLPKMKVFGQFKSTLIYGGIATVIAMVVVVGIVGVNLYYSDDQPNGHMMQARTSTPALRQDPIPRNRTIRAAALGTQPTRVEVPLNVCLDFAGDDPNGNAFKFWVRRSGNTKYVFFQSTDASRPNVYLNFKRSARCQLGAA